MKMGGSVNCGANEAEELQHQRETWSITREKSEFHAAPHSQIRWNRVLTDLNSKQQ